MVLSGQDVLIDVARLLSRYPSLLNGQGLESFARVPLTPKAIENLGLAEAAVAPHLYPKTSWLSRKAWFRSAVMDDQAIKENEEGLPPDTDLRFIEDGSRFLPS